MTDHTSNQHDDTDMTIEEFDRAFDQGVPAVQRPPGLRVQGNQTSTAGQGIRLASSVASVEAPTERRSSAISVIGPQTETAA